MRMNSRKLSRSRSGVFGVRRRLGGFVGAGGRARPAAPEALRPSATPPRSRRAPQAGSTTRRRARTARRGRRSSVALAPSRWLGSRSRADNQGTTSNSSASVGKSGATARGRFSCSRASATPRQNSARKSCSGPAAEAGIGARRAPPLQIPHQRAGLVDRREPLPERGQRGLSRGPLAHQLDRLAGVERHLPVGSAGSEQRLREIRRTRPARRKSSSPGASTSSASASLCPGSTRGGPSGPRPRAGAAARRAARRRLRGGGRAAAAAAP